MPRRMLTDRFCASAKLREGEAQTDYFDARRAASHCECLEAARLGPTISLGAADAFA
jgi:hypothetical protein